MTELTSHMTLGGFHLEYRIEECNCHCRYFNRNSVTSGIVNDMILDKSNNTVEEINNVIRKRDMIPGIEKA